MRLYPSKNWEIFQQKNRLSTSIYFDFNAPILTNTVATEIIDVLLVIDLESKKEQITLYPNPVNNILNIKTKNGTVINTISVFNVAGKLIYKSKNNFEDINFEDYSKGVYFLKVITNNGELNKRVIKR